MNRDPISECMDVLRAQREESERRRREREEWFRVHVPLVQQSMPGFLLHDLEWRRLALSMYGTDRQQREWSDGLYPAPGSVYQGMKPWSRP